MMSFMEELEARITQYEGEIRRLQGLASHAKALLEEEAKTSQYRLPEAHLENDAAGDSDAEVTVPRVVREALSGGGIVSFRSVLDEVHRRVFPDSPPSVASKRAAAALSREVKRGTIIRVRRGQYRQASDGERNAVNPE